MRSFLLVLLLVFNLQAGSVFGNQKQEDTSKYINNLKNLILATQKTRGLTNSYLNGNTAAMLLVFANRDDMKTAIGNMESFSLASDPVINPRATAISQALTKLNYNAFKQSPKKTFSDYTEQIQQILMLAQSVSKRSAKNLTAFGKDMSSVMMEIMLPMTEYAGQLRGAGAGIAAKGKVTKDDVQNIMLLSYQLKANNKKLQKRMSQLMSKYSGKLPEEISSELASVNRSVMSYTTFADKKLLTHPEKVDADQFFDNGTQVISNIIKVYNTSNRAIMKDAKGWF